MTTRLHEDRFDEEATIPLGGKPQTGVVDPAAGRVYVNIEDKNEIAVVDTATHAVTARWPIAWLA